MNSEQEEFQQLRRLLALKRYEQPPPGFFHDFSREVIIRIRSGEHIDRASIFEILSWEAPWLQRLWAAVETRPIVAGAFGFAVCALLLGGLLFTETQDNAPPPAATSGMTTMTEPEAANAAQLQAANPVAAPALPIDHASPAGTFSVQSGVIPATDSLFEQLKGAKPAQIQFINSPGYPNALR